MRDLQRPATDSQPSSRTIALLVGLGVIALVAIVFLMRAPKELPARLPGMGAVLGRAEEPLGASFAQIPATVVDKGDMRLVPYCSYRAANYEVNVYGDPDAPACVEIGATGPSAGVTAAHGTCVRAMLALLEDEGDRQALLSLKQETGRVERNGLTLEITPPTAPDAYGGWWVSVYDVRALEVGRAIPEQLAAITVTETAAKPEEQATPQEPTKAQERPTAQERQPDQVVDWKPADFAFARPAPTTQRERTVYVRGYTRKDGTYVRPHTRSR